jgi:phosphoribosylamine-glycine ligase
MTTTDYNLDWQACAERRLDSVKIDTRKGSAVSVILASQGYPGSYPKGKAISITDVPSGEIVHILACNEILIMPQA